MLTLLFWIVIFFRWRIFGKLVGLVRMFFVDAVMFCAFSAYGFAHPMEIPWLGYVIASLCLLFSVDSLIHYQKASALERLNNGDPTTNK